MITEQALREYLNKRYSEYDGYPDGENDFGTINFATEQIILEMFNSELYCARVDELGIYTGGACLPYIGDHRQHVGWEFIEDICMDFDKGTGAFEDQFNKEV